jgi:hypothetical protein
MAPRQTIPQTRGRQPNVRAEGVESRPSAADTVRAKAPAPKRARSTDDRWTFGGTAQARGTGSAVQPGCRLRQAVRDGLPRVVGRRAGVGGRSLVVLDARVGVVRRAARGAREPAKRRGSACSVTWRTLGPLFACSPRGTAPECYVGLRPAVVMRLHGPGAGGESAVGESPDRLSATAHGPHFELAMPEAQKLGAPAHISTGGSEWKHSRSQ